MNLTNNVSILLCIFAPMLSFTEENYLKALLRLVLASGVAGHAGTNELASHLGVKPATVNNMLKKLKDKKLIRYQKYGKISFTAEGRRKAVMVLRRHRLWETFLFEKLEFTWDEVHEVAEQLEHINSDKLMKRLDKFLNHPVIDPHGDPIPGTDGNIPHVGKTTLSEIGAGKSCTVAAVKDTSTDFLQYLQHLSVNIGTKIKVFEFIPFDGSLQVQIGRNPRTMVSKRLAESLVVDLA